MEKRTFRIREVAAVAAVAALVACSPAPSSTPSGSTTSSTSGSSSVISTPVSANGVATTVSGAATNGAAATAVAGAATSGASSTVLAGANAAAPAAGTAVSGAAGAAPVRIMGASLTPSDPTLTIQNTSSQSVDMTGWKLQVGSAAVSMPSAAKVGPNDTVTIHVTTGSSAGKDVYLGSDAATLSSALKPGAKVAIVNSTGTTVSEFALPA